MLRLFEALLDEHEKGREFLVEARRWRDRAVKISSDARVDMPSPNHDSRGHDERGGAPVDMLLLALQG